MFPMLHSICPLLRDLTILARQTNFEELGDTDVTHLLWNFLLEHEYTDPGSVKVHLYLEETYSNPRNRRGFYVQRVLIEKMFQFLIRHDD